MASGGEQAVEERPVALQRDAEILRRDLVAAVPLALEAAPLLREAVCEPLHEVGDECVGVLDCAAGLVDEAALDLAPAGLDVARRVVLEQPAVLLRLRGIADRLAPLVAELLLERVGARVGVGFGSANAVVGDRLTAGDVCGRGAILALHQRTSS